MLELEVGKSYTGNTGPVPEGTMVEILPDTILYALYMYKPEPKEIEVFQSGKADVRIHFENDVIFFLMKLGELGWLDAPYSKYLSPSQPDLTPPPEGQGFSITLVLVDASNQIIKGLRMTTLSRIQSRNLIDYLKIQRDISDYDETIAKLYRKYPTSEDMIKRQ